MNKLYTKSNLEILKKKQKQNLILFLIFLLTLSVSLITFILVATFETRTLFSIICSVISTIVTYFFIHFVCRFNYYRHLATDFEFILNGKEQITVATFLDISLKPITLPDKCLAYVVKIATPKGNRTIYLSSLFNNNLFEVGKRYKFFIVFDYIVGFEDEH